MPHYRGSGGGVWEITPPEPGTARRRQFDEFLASGELVEVDGPEPTPTPKPARKPRTPKPTE